MGIYSVFGGLIYNDFASIPIEYPWGSCFNDFENNGVAKFAHDVHPYNCVPPIGIDSIWSRAVNSLQFGNSFKMKLSVILGVLHMSLGIFMKAFNAMYFRRYVDFFFEFLP